MRCLWLICQARITSNEMPRKYKAYSDEDVIRYVSETNNISQLLDKLNLKKAGGNYYNIKRIIQRLNIDCSHWGSSKERQAWNKGEQQKDWDQYTRANRLKPHLIIQRGHQCESCKNTIWMDNPIPLELDHIDGNKTNNELSNLRLLCCNCHALTPTWRGRKRLDK